MVLPETKSVWKKLFQTDQLVRVVGISIQEELANQ